MYHRLKFAAAVAHHFKINEYNIRTIVKKSGGEETEIHDAIPAAMPASKKPCTFCEMFCIENAVFM